VTTPPIRELFVSDVTRDIPPVVYFDEQTPEKLAEEVDEYIITGGWPKGTPNHRRVPDGIHEQYVRLLRAIVSELDKPGGPELPTAWIAGFYGSGKSSFAKLLGLALDGVALPDGRSLAEALLARDTSPRKGELRAAWAELRKRVDPIAAVFDIGSAARTHEHIHATAIRQVQIRLGYCSTQPLVADYELKLERAGRWADFERVAEQALGRPWSAAKDDPFAEEDFSRAMAALEPDTFTEPMAWFMSRVGTHTRWESPEEAVRAIGDMIGYRSPGSTLFLVVDEVSQYVLGHKDRVDRLRAFTSALGANLKGKAWLLALGQQKLDEEADDSFLVWAKDRFPAKLRVHLAHTNIRDVVHKRLLQKKPAQEARLRDLFEANRPNLKLYGYGCEEVTPDEFVEVYPMLPGHIDLLLQITSALRTRSTRAQGDDQAIRGLLQLLGELFRDQKLADLPVGALVTLDAIYEVQHTALDNDTQASMARVLDQCSGDASGLLVKAAKAVAMLELIQDTVPTDARLVAQCLYDRVDRGNRVGAVTDALEDLRRRNLLGYSEKHGYKIQSSAGEEWERDRRDQNVPREVLSQIVLDALKDLLARPERPRLQGRPFPWSGVLSDGRRLVDATVQDPREDAAVRVDFRYLNKDERTESAWVKRSDETALRDRLVWVVGEDGDPDHHARELARSRMMVRKYTPRRESLNRARRDLLRAEKDREEDLGPVVRHAVAAAFLSGSMYFRGRPLSPLEQGPTFAAALQAAATRMLPDLFPHFVATPVQPSEVLQLIAPELSGIPGKFLSGDLGIFELDAGRFVPTCSGIVPRRIAEHVDAEGGLGGTTLLAHFGGPPFGYPPNVVKACVAGLLRGSRVRIQPDGGAEITAIRDADAREVFDKDRAFRRASFFPGGDDDIGFQARAKICRFFKKSLDLAIDREDHAIADAVAQRFPAEARRLRDVITRLDRLPGRPDAPGALTALGDVLEQCVATSRQTRPTVHLVKRRLDVLRDGLQLLRRYDAELTEDAIRAVREAAAVRDNALAQLRVGETMSVEVDEAGTRLADHLGAPRPWRDVAALGADIAAVRDAYAAERSRLLQRQEQRAEGARGEVKGRTGFSILTAEQSHRVLRPIALVLTDTSADAVAPARAALRDPCAGALERATGEANERLDAILSAGDRPLIRRVDLLLRNRELATEADVDALLDELRAKLLEHLRAGARIRLV